MKSSGALLLVFVTSSLVAAAAAQSCPQLQATGDSATMSCVASCCSGLDACYTASDCELASDWPKGLKTACEKCNQRFTVCSGLCLVTPELSQFYGRSPPASCQPSCSNEFTACGTPDGCGGVCGGVALCGFLVRRPEFFPIIF